MLITFFRPELFTFPTTGARCIEDKGRVKVERKRLLSWGTGDEYGWKPYIVQHNLSVEEKNTELNLGVVKYTAELKRNVKIKKKECHSVGFRMFGLSLQVHNFYLDFYGGALLWWSLWNSKSQKHRAFNTFAEHHINWWVNIHCTVLFICLKGLCNGEF